jgi:tetratricopeptide (TPR) repeat protein
MVVGDQNTALRFAEESLERAEQQDDHGPLLEAHRLMGLSKYWGGSFQDSLNHFQKVQILYKADRDKDLALIYGQNHIISSYSIGAGPLAILGFYDKSKDYSRKAVHEARESNHIYSLAYAITLPFFPAAFQRNYVRILEIAEEVIPFCLEHVVPFYLTMGYIFKGFALAHVSEIDEGVAQIHEGISQYRATGSGMCMPLFNTFLAQALMLKGNDDEAKPLVEESIDQVTRWGENFYHAETLRLLGDLQLSSPSLGYADPEIHYGNAIELARHQEAKLWELRATNSLARLWGERGERQKGYDLLRPIYGWFTEGLDTADLTEARRLLEELASAT